MQKHVSSKDMRALQKTLKEHPELSAGKGAIGYRELRNLSHSDAVKASVPETVLRRMGGKLGDVLSSPVAGKVAKYVGYAGLGLNAVGDFLGDRKKGWSVAHSAEHAAGSTGGMFVGMDSAVGIRKTESIA